MYQTTLRLYNDVDIDLIKGLKEKFGISSMSTCIVRVVVEYYRLKEFEKLIKNNITTKYESKSGVLEGL
ncbi:MAG: hypothetical protein KAV40_06010 [Thermoplasmatales archaeon]|nr:hypothetical protein [Thermoplasmatales archaeon]